MYIVNLSKNSFLRNSSSPGKSATNKYHDSCDREHLNIIKSEVADIKRTCKPYKYTYIYVF